MRKNLSADLVAGARIEGRSTVASIWPTKILAPASVRTPREVLVQSAKELAESGSPYRAEVGGENNAQGNPSKRTDLYLRWGDKKRRAIATVEYPPSGYPATLILGETDYLFVSVATEEELRDELRQFLGALNVDL